MQLSKTVYFRDYSLQSGVRSGLTIPFGETDLDLFRFVEPLSSFRIRELLGFDLFAELERAAVNASSPVATFARGLLQKKTAQQRLDRTPTRENALQSTFRGGKGSPLHDWYPYLEGYSPDFVSTILQNYAPGASRVLDPFCGSGTTALVSSGLGKTGLYSEVNPVCRFIIEAKASALKLDTAARHQIADELENWAQSLPRLLKTAKPAGELGEAFFAVFGKRPFFDPCTFENILRLRSVIDKIQLSNQRLARFATVAILRSLVSGSLLVRRGDLRFRTDAELARDTPDFLRQLVESCTVVASDLLDASVAPGEVQFVCTDARQLGQHLTQPVDAIITSPPYLNGTNYFRNTKIELWFLRELSAERGLRAYRDAAITAGINDVTVGKSLAPASFSQPESLIGVLAALREDTYDQRIPLMVQSYFQEMAAVIKGLSEVVHQNTTVAIDLGDSCYGDVWVPTDLILSELMEQQGFVRNERIILRERQSRDGRKLSQTLQVFSVRPPAVRSKAASKISDAVSVRWNTFRDTLPHQRGDMAKRNWGHSWHSLCSYQGKLKPSIAHTLVNALLPKSGGRMLDPFSGVGTVPFEARLQGHTAFGFDISPAAIAISKAKLERVSAPEVEQVQADLKAWVAKYSKKKLDLEKLDVIRFNGPLSGYFHPTTLAEIVAARAFFQKIGTPDGAHALVLSALLHVLHGNRPYALSRRSHPITPFAPTGPTEYRSLTERLNQKLTRCLADLDGPLPEGRSFFQDATAHWPDEVSDLDAIITSPPFFDSTRFYSANWMRLWFAGWDASDFVTKPASFVDERQKHDFAVYEPIFRQAAERLKPGGYFAIHLGKSKKCDMGMVLSEIGSRYLKQVDAFTESVEHCESHGIRDKGAVTHHQYVLFQRA